MILTHTPMLLLPCVSSVRVWSPAKVNLFLEVIRRRPDGFHDLATLMVTIGLYDALVFRPNSSDVIHLECDHPGLSTGPENLVCRAAQLLRDRFAIRKGVSISLSKRIPMAAGLAGGSSDAAATLAGLNRLWKLGLDAHALASLGAELGSDVSFFFHGPAAWCTGRGEIVEPLRPGQSLRSLYLILVSPDMGLSTASVFKALTLSEPPREGVAIQEAFRKGDITALGRAMYNRLEEPAMRLSPEVRRIADRLRETASLGVMMSGSGSTVFALAQSAAEAGSYARVVKTIREDGIQARVHVVRVCI